MIRRLFLHSAALGFVLLVCATAKVSALTESYNFSADPVYDFGSTQPGAAQMANAVSTRLGRTITVVSSLQDENTSLAPLTANTDASPNYIYGPAANGVIKNLNLNTAIITGITSGSIRSAGQETLGTGTFNLFVLRLFTSTQYYDVFIKTTYSGYLPDPQGYRNATWACYRISAPRNINALLNISSRAQVFTGQNVMIVGFYVQGTAAKSVLIRGIGPSLANYGLTGVMSDPTLELRNSSGTLIASNNNWGDSQYSQIAATGLQPSNSYESAILTSLSPGSYTATLKGYGGGTGIASCEMYDMDQSANSQFVNLSSRAYVSPDPNALIAGVYVGTVTGTTHVVIRAIGPSLGNYGIAGPLQDPTLEVRNAYGTLIISNNNWQDNAQQAAAVQAAGLAPSNYYESAASLYLSAGSYTAIVRDANGGSGVGVVEMYKVP